MSFLSKIVEFGHALLWSVPVAFALAGIMYVIKTVQAIRSKNK